MTNEFKFFDHEEMASALCAICVTAAVIGGVSAAGSVASAAIGAGAAKSAAKTQAQSAEKAQQIQEKMYAQTRSDLAPYRAVGTEAQQGYEALLGIGPHGTSGMMDWLKSTPGFQFALEQGLQATQSGYAAHGLAVSGPALKGAAQYAEGLAGTTYQNVLANYQNALTLGENAAAQTGTIGANYAAQESSAVTAAGAASAAGTIGAANATIGGINSGVAGISNALLTPAMFSALGGSKGLYGGFGGGGFGTASPGGGLW